MSTTRLQQGKKMEVFTHVCRRMNEGSAAAQDFWSHHHVALLCNREGCWSPDSYPSGCFQAEQSSAATDPAVGSNEGSQAAVSANAEPEH